MGKSLILCYCALLYGNTLKFALYRVFSVWMDNCTAMMPFVPYRAKLGVFWVCVGVM